MKKRHPAPQRPGRAVPPTDPAASAASPAACGWRESEFYEPARADPNCTCEVGNIAPRRRQKWRLSTRPGIGGTRARRPRPCHEQRKAYLRGAHGPTADHAPRMQLEPQPLLGGLTKRSQNFDYAPRPSTPHNICSKRAPARFRGSHGPSVCVRAPDREPEKVLALCTPGRAAVAQALMPGRASADGFACPQKHAGAAELVGSRRGAGRGRNICRLSRRGAQRAPAPAGVG